MAFTNYGLLYQTAAIKSRKIKRMYNTFKKELTSLSEVYFACFDFVSRINNK